MIINIEKHISFIPSTNGLKNNSSAKLFKDMENKKKAIQSFLKFKNTNKHSNEINVACNLSKHKTPVKAFICSQKK